MNRSRIPGPRRNGIGSILILSYLVGFLLQPLVGEVSAIPVVPGSDARSLDRTATTRRGRWLSVDATTSMDGSTTTTTEDDEKEEETKKPEDDDTDDDSQGEVTVLDTILAENSDTDTTTTTDATTLPTDGTGDDSSTNHEEKDRGIPFPHFIAHNSTMTCTADEHASPFNMQIRGVNLGGWMVLEPWITPSIFYQFLNGAEGTTAFDMYTFCKVLGPKEANRQLRRHWERWVTEDIIQKLADSGAVNALRLPVGDYQFVPYGPYKDCVEGGLEYIDQLLDWAHTYGLSVLIDVHTMKDSQNGFDNSGQTMGFEWTSSLTTEFAGLTTFQHWPIRTAEWIGDFDPKTSGYTNIKYNNIQHALRVVQKIVDRYAEHPAVLGLEPLNEPWQYTPLDALKRFYWDGYLIVKKTAPSWKYVIHDSFRLDAWGGFMDGCPERALDTHFYQAWRDPDSRLGFYIDACRQKSAIAQAERDFGPVIVGEWSLATDNCAMWLNGFNDNLPGFSRLPCKYTPCRDSYLGTEQPGVPLDPTKPLQGPYGTGMSGPIFGLCPGSRDWLKESGDPLTGRDWVKAPPSAPKHLDDTDTVMRNLALKKIDAFSGIGHGFFFWNFRTDLYEPQWSYLAALERGWIPKGSLSDDSVTNACIREDSGTAFKCVLKKGQIDSGIRTALRFAFNAEGVINSLEAQQILNLTGSELYDAAEPIVEQFFDAYRHQGVTCDFGGVAMLAERNVTLSDQEVSWNDEVYVTRGPSTWKLVLAGTGIAVVAALVGFISAMRCNKGFNRRVRSSGFFQPIARTKSKVIRSSLNLPELDYDEIVDLSAPKDLEGYK